MNHAQTIITFLKTHIGHKKAIIGISGGIDSALVATLTVAAIGKEQVHGILMPSESNTREETDRGIELVTQLGITHETVSIDPIVAALQSSVSFFSSKATLGNAKARIRMNLLYGLANTLGGLVIGTGNKTELLLGYFTKYGDAGVDLLPIADLYKKDVQTMAHELGVPQSIINAPPTAGLWKGQTDEQELEMTYAEADAILEAIEQNQSLESFDKAIVQNVQTRIAESTHKRSTPPICILPH